jgi:hypothetical protein
MSDIKEEAIRILNLYNDTSHNLSFTIFMAKTERTNKELYNALLEELNTDKYIVKYLDSTGL